MWDDVVFGTGGILGMKVLKLVLVITTVTVIVAFKAVGLVAKWIYRCIRWTCAAISRRSHARKIARASVLAGAGQER